MALIELKPGESYEHFHSRVSTTTHINGTIELTFNNNIFIMKSGEQVIIPDRTLHITRNIGNTLAIFDCGSHSTEEGG